MKGSVSSLAKEKEPAKILAEKEEEVKVREAQERTEIARELESYVAHVETEPEITRELSQVGAVNPAQAATQVLDQEPTIILPLTREEVKKGLLAPVWQAMRWLAEWSTRVAKIAAKHGIRVIFGRGREEARDL